MTRSRERDGPERAPVRRSDERRAGVGVPALASAAAPPHQPRADQLGRADDAHAAEPAEHAGGLHVLVDADRSHVLGPPPSPGGGRGSAGRRAGGGPLHPPGRRRRRARSPRCSSRTSPSGSPTASCAATATPSATRAATTRAMRSTCCRSTACTPAWTEQLRAHEGGRLKSQTIGGEEFPPYLYDGGGKKPEFSDDRGRPRPDQIPPERLDRLFAMRQRHGQPPGRLRAAQHAVPARAQPGRGRARGRVPGLGRRAAVPDRAQRA